MGNELTLEKNMTIKTPILSQKICAPFFGDSMY